MAYPVCANDNRNSHDNRNSFTVLTHNTIFIATLLQDNGAEFKQ